jgi:hypothetical protein
MTNCREIQKSMDEVLTTGADDARMDGVLDHIESCTDCAAHFELLSRLRTDDLVGEPADAELLAMRRSVLREIRKGASSSSSFVERIRFLFAQPGFVVGLAMLMLATGFIVGTGSRPDSVSPVIAATSDERLVDEIQLAAVRHTAFEDVVQAPYRYANVKVSEEPGGRVGLTFDVSRHVDVVVPKDDPMVGEVLVQSLLGENPVGTKLKAISTSNAMEPKVREALIRTMMNDENLGVRLRAQDRLVSIEGDPEVEQALLEVLRTEESVQMRLVAIDYLTAGKVRPELMRDAVLGDEDDPRVDAVYVRAMQYLNETN